MFPRVEVARNADLQMERVPNTCGRCVEVDERKAALWPQEREVESDALGGVPEASGWRITSKVSRTARLTSILEYAAYAVSAAPTCYLEYAMEVLSRYEINTNRPRLFAVENDSGKKMKVSMHPKCYIDMCASGINAVCVPCLRQLDLALNGRSK